MRSARLISWSVAATLVIVGQVDVAHAAVAVEPDTAAPVIESFTFDRASAPWGEVRSTMTAHVVDPGSGVASVSVYFERDLPEGAHVRYGPQPLSGISGTPHDGVYTGPFGAPYNASNGDFSVHVVTVDEAGNRLDRTLEQTIFIGSTRPDLWPADVSAVAVEPTTVSDGGTVTVRAHISDYLMNGGVAEATAALVWTGDGGGTVSARYEAPLVRTSGDDWDGDYRAAITIPSFAIAGDYEVRIRTLDAGRNDRELAYGQVTVGGVSPDDYPRMNVFGEWTAEMAPDGAVAEIPATVSSLTDIVSFTAAVLHTNPDGSTARYEGPFKANGTRYLARVPIPAAAPRGAYRVEVRLTVGAGIVLSEALGDRLTVLPPTAPPPHTPGDLTVEAAGAAGTRIAFAATGTCSPASGTVFPLGATTVTCHTPTGSGTFRITVEDRTPPVLKLPAAVAADAPDPRGAIVAYTASASATDTVDGAVTPTCTPTQRTRFPLGPTTVTCRATDRAGNAATGTFVVTVADDRAQLDALRDYVVALGRAGRSLLPAIDAVHAAPTDATLFRLIMRTRLSGLTAAQRSHIISVTERIRRYHRPS